jgi:hypothetical protein
LRTLAAERLDRLCLAGFNALSEMGPDELHLTGRWGIKGSIRTEIVKVDENTILVAIMYGTTAWWWPVLRDSYSAFFVHRGEEYERFLEPGR